MGERSVCTDRVLKNGQRFRSQWEPGRDPISNQGILDFGHTPRDLQCLRLRDCTRPVGEGCEKDGGGSGATPPLGGSGESGKDHADPAAVRSGHRLRHPP